VFQATIRTGLSASGCYPIASGISHRGHGLIRKLAGTQKLEKMYNAHPPRRGTLDGALFFLIPDATCGRILPSLRQSDSRAPCVDGTNITCRSIPGS